ncbi:uncharacterized protein CCOS01_14120 [Colletotrichum costaricense]|uniref:Uncharacterized protein n=1 Tax=Colletotrichum costaricense TaxID=1209916 RepID=A0AAI9YK51_9PEZI|nr:uncharacterized protein CCOS01_14120 [Colletotrichum costaricense]KAK1514180.1 hypothetical protein CCOS01_14120 [Colletotrichum costaricense]
MASKRQTTASRPRRDSANATGSQSTAKDRMRVTKAGAQTSPNKLTDGLRSKTRSSTRSHIQSYVGMESSDEEDSIADESEDFEESPRTSRKSPRKTPTKASDGRGASRAGTKRKSTTTARDFAPKRGRGRPRKVEASPRKAKHDFSDESEDNGFEDELSDAKPTPKTTPAKPRGRPPKNKVDIDMKTTSPIIPNWLDPQIAHSIWVQIFQFAAISGDEQDTLDVNWILHTARTCRQFADPALTVLYKCPPVRDETKAYGLAELLEKPPSQTTFNYRAKIEALHIDVRLVSLRGLTSPLKLMQNLPRLKEVLLVHGFDQAPFRKLKESIKWTYPDELFEAFEVSPTAAAEAGEKTAITRLQSWQWSSRLMDKNWDASLARLQEVHQMPSFVSLRKLKFVNYQMPSIRLDKDPETNPELLAEDQKSVSLLANSILALPNLDDLVFESSTIITTSLFPLLPARLRRLELVNCAEVIADDFSLFLVTKGHQLQSLVLNHNRSLNLSFLTVLGTACPHLKELRMNLQYFSLLESSNDRLPSYDTLLLPNEVPSWPASLQVVHLENLRHWSSGAADTAVAEAFLQSLIDSAEELPDLRHISIKAMLSISWRSRVELRKSWQEKFEKIFLRQSPDPKPHFTLQKPLPVESSPLVVGKRKSKKPAAEPSRRSKRVVSHASGTSSRASSTSRGLRGQQLQPKSYAEPDSDEFDSENDVDMEEPGEEFNKGETDEASEEAAADTFVQGMCNVVDIHIDNQKPREHQYSMDDFLNDERDFEVDDEWDSDMDYA